MIPNDWFKIENIEVLEDDGQDFVFSCYIDGVKRQISAKRQINESVNGINMNDYAFKIKDLDFVHSEEEFKALQSKLKIKLKNKEINLCNDN